MNYMRKNDYKEIASNLYIRIFVITIMMVIVLMLVGCGSNIQKPLYEEKYLKVLDNELANPRHGENKLYYGYGYVDEDDIPELFVVRGTRHIDTVSIYTFDEKNNEAIYVGDFGGWGYCHYVPYENKIISCYGNQGYFYTTVSSITKDKDIKLAEAILRIDGNRIESFYGFDMGDFTGAIDWTDYDVNQWDEPGSEYVISETIADAISDRIMAEAVRIDAQEVCTEYLDRK